MCGVLVSGDVFLWHKDTDLLRIIPGLPELADRLAAGKDDHSSPKGTSRTNLWLVTEGLQLDLHHVFHSILFLCFCILRGVLHRCITYVLVPLTFVVIFTMF